MDDRELAIIIDINKSLGNLNSTLKTLCDNTKNLTDAISKQSTNIQLVDQKIDFLKDITDKISDVVMEVKEKVTILTRQMDYKETKEFKEKKIEEQIQKKDEVEKKKFSWSGFGDGFKIFMKNSKWIFFILLILILGLLLSLKVVEWKDVKHYVPNPNTISEETK